MCWATLWLFLLLMGFTSASATETNNPDHSVFILPGQEAMLQDCLELNDGEVPQLRFTGASIGRDKVRAQYEFARNATIVEVTFVYPDSSPGPEGDLATGLRIEKISGADETTSVTLRKSINHALKKLEGVFRWSRSRADLDPGTTEPPRTRILNLIRKAETDLDANDRASFTQTLDAIQSAQKALAQTRDTMWVTLQVARLRGDAGEEAEQRALLLSLREQIDAKIGASEQSDTTTLARLEIMKARTLVGLERGENAVQATLSVLKSNTDAAVICACTQVVSDFLKKGQLAPARVVLTGIKTKGVQCARLETLEATLEDAVNTPIAKPEHVGDAPKTAAASKSAPKDSPKEPKAAAPVEKTWQGNSSAAPWIILLLCALAGLFFQRSRKGTKLKAPQLALGFMVILGAGFRILLPPKALYGNWAALSELVFPGFAVGAEVPIQPIWGFQALVGILNGLSGVHVVPLTFWLNIAFGVGTILVASSLGRRLHETPWAPFLYACVASFSPLAIKFSASETEMVPFCFFTLLAFRLAMEVGATRIGTIALGATLALLCYLRPEGACVAPGVFLLAGLQEKQKQREHGEKNGRATRNAMLLAGVLAFPALWTIYQLQIDGQGLTTAQLGLASETSRPGWLAIAALLAGRIFDPGWNHLLNLSFTPLVFVGLAAIGGVALLRKVPRLFISLAVSVIPLVFAYSCFDANEATLGGARLQHGLMAFVFVFAGAGAAALVDLLNGLRPLPTLYAVLMGAVVALSTLPYMNLVQEANHPAQEEFKLLAERFLHTMPPLENNAVVILSAPHIEEQLPYTHFGPELFFANNQKNIVAVPWTRIDTLSDVARKHKRNMYLYMGLHAHYSSGPGGNTENWLRKGLLLQGRGAALKSPPRLKTIFRETRPFVANALDRKRGFDSGEFQVALFQVTLD